MRGIEGRCLGFVDIRDSLTYKHDRLLVAIMKLQLQSRFI